MCIPRKCEKATTTDLSRPRDVFESRDTTTDGPDMVSLAMADAAERAAKGKTLGSGNQPDRRPGLC